MAWFGAWCTGSLFWCVEIARTHFERSFSGIGQPLLTTAGSNRCQRRLNRLKTAKLLKTGEASGSKTLAIQPSRDEWTLRRNTCASYAYGGAIRCPRSDSSAASSPVHSAERESPRRAARPLPTKLAHAVAARTPSRHDGRATTRDEIAHGPKRVRLGDAAQGPARPRVVHVLAASAGTPERRT